MDWDRDSYRAKVAKVFSGGEHETVFNGTLDHACIVTEEAFRAAKHHVRILTNKLDPACYGTPAVLDAALEFIANPDARLDVLVEDPSAVAAGRNIFLKEMSAAGDKRVRVGIVPTDTTGRYEFNFLSLDECAYRFESDRANPIAIVGCESTTAKHLAKLFDSLWTHTHAEASSVA